MTVVYEYDILLVGHIYLLDTPLLKLHRNIILR